MTRLEPLTPAIFTKFYGQAPFFDFRGIAAIDDKGDCVAVCAEIDSEAGTYIAMDAKAEAPPRDIVRGWNQFKKTLKQGKDYFALKDTELTTAESLLLHFGFQPYKGDIYLYRP